MIKMDNFGIIWSERMQKEITSPCRVFESDGRVLNAGWARQNVFEYNPGGMHSQRDCYCINSNECSLYLSIESLGSVFAVNIALADLRRGGVVSDGIVKKSHFIKRALPNEFDSGEFEFEDRFIRLRIQNTTRGKSLKCEFEEFGSLEKLGFDIFLIKNNSNMLDELAPFERNRKYYYLKRFMPCYSAQGFILAGSMKYNLSAESAFAYFDQTRFRKPRKHNYQRLGADCFIGGKRFTLCLASRVGDNRFGNENCFFVDGKLEKLSQITVKGTPNRIDRPFFFRGGVTALDISFKPFTVSGKAMIAQMYKTSVVFGRLYGTINRIDYEKPLVVDNTVAHLIFSEF